MAAGKNADFIAVNKVLKADRALAVKFQGQGQTAQQLARQVQTHFVRRKIGMRPGGDRLLLRLLLEFGWEIREVREMKTNDSARMWRRRGSSGVKR